MKFNGTRVDPILESNAIRDSIKLFAGLHTSTKRETFPPDLYSRMIERTPAEEEGQAVGLTG